MNKFSVSLLLFVSLLLTSCGEYSKLLKSTDYELKYSKAVQYFDRGDFIRASTLFDAVSGTFKGTERSEYVLNYLARSYVGQKDYYTASDYYSTYIKTYPKGKFIIESRYMVGYCYYLDSPDARLDQASTHNAIDAFEQFIELYPESERVPEAQKLLDEMNDKLAYKSYLNAKLYYNLGNYMGNNFESAVITADNALKKYPATRYRENLYALILEAKYELAQMSVEQKKIDRYRNTIDEYYNFINEFPNSKFRKTAERIFKEAQKIVKE